MGQYVIRCDCSPDRPVAGWIDDGRPDGPVRLRLPPGPLGHSVRVAATRRGGRRGTHRVCCPRCGVYVRLTDSTAAELVDLIAHGAAPLRDVWGTQMVAVPECVDPGARADEFDRDPNAPSSVPTTIRHRSVWVIPLAGLRRVVGGLDKRR